MNKCDRKSPRGRSPLPAKMTMPPAWVPAHALEEVRRAAVPRRSHAVYSSRVLKFLLMSVVLGTFLVPAATASGRKPLKALQATLAWMALVGLAYVFFLRFLYGRFV
jgi:hypothetical protein